MPSKKKVIPPAKVILEKIVTENSDFLYTNLPAEWQVQDIVNFSANIHLYPYQQKALQCVSSVLYTHFSKKALSESYAAHGRAEIDSLNRACFWMATGSGKTLLARTLAKGSSGLCTCAPASIARGSVHTNEESLPWFDQNRSRS